MTINKKSWIFYTAAALLGFCLWFIFGYSWFASVDLSIDRPRALHIAKNFLRQSGSDPKNYLTACIFSYDKDADRFLQRTLGFKAENKFLRENNYELFFWTVRFFRENEKEEYKVQVSAANGEIISFRHSIEDTAKRKLTDETDAKQTVIAFLKRRYGFDPTGYLDHTHLTKKYENRTDYTFAWEKKNIYIPWSKKPNTGGAKLLIGARISGDDILAFYKNDLDIPDDFSRYIKRLKDTGTNLSIIFSFLSLIILISAIFFTIARRNHVVLHTVKRFMIALTACLFLLSLFNYANKAQTILFNYKTTSAMASYLWQTLSVIFVTTLLSVASILILGLAGESLHTESYPDKKKGGFLFYLSSSFWAKDVFGRVTLGYLVCCILLGVQAFLFYIGRQYLGVWSERYRITQLSSSYFPFLTAFVVGLSAGFFEEITYRLYALSWFKKIFKSTLLAVFCSSMIWGFGHSGYAVFPMWFRGIEVTILGIIFAVVYLRYGILTAIVAHYLMDVFWVGSSYLLGKSNAFNFFSIIGVLLIPLLYGIVSLIMNKPENERPIRWRLSKPQLFNLKILENYLANDPEASEKPAEELRTKLIKSGWDVAVIEEAFKEEAHSND